MGNSVPTWGPRISASPHTRTQVIKTQTVKGRVLNPQAEATYSFAGSWLLRRNKTLWA